MLCQLKSCQLVNYCKTVLNKCHYKRLVIGKWPSWSLRSLVLVPINRAHLISYSSSIVTVSQSQKSLPSVIWCCWLGDRKGIWPVKKLSGGVLAWLHESNFYIVDLENFATASRRYTDDIHNSNVAGLFMTPIRRWKWLAHITTECTCLLPTLTLQLHNIALFRTCRSAVLRGNWQDFNWHDASRGPVATAELLVHRQAGTCND